MLLIEVCVHVRMLIISCLVRLVLNCIFQLSAYLRNLLQLLNGRLVALQCRLNHLSGPLFSLRQFFESLCILLLLLKQGLVIMAGLLRLLNELLGDLFALMEGLLGLIVCEVHVNSSLLVGVITKD